MTVRTRFAPSPTGYLHVGGLRTALYSFLFAKHHEGEFFLRIEDTDQSRYVRGAEEKLKETLKYMGIAWDGKAVKQSRRIKIYQKAAHELVKKNKAYYCFCAEERLKVLRKRQEENNKPTGYDGLCRNISQEVAEKRKKSESYVIRLKMPKKGICEFQDAVRGKVSFSYEREEDIIILKSDGFPTYHLAYVIDDHEMKITHVIRGEEWLPSIPKHIVLWQSFGWEMPAHAHLSLIVNPDKTKLSKRQGDVSVESYLEKGYVKEALLNFILLLGWNPGTEKEIFTLQEMTDSFTLEKINTSPAVFNFEKLDWMNGVYIRKKNIKELVELSFPYLEKAGLLEEGREKKYIEKVLLLEQTRIKKFSELPELVGYFFQEIVYDASLLLWKNETKEQAKANLLNIKKILQTLKTVEFTKNNIESIIMNFIRSENLKNGDVLWPMRLALSGKEKSPGPFEIADALGKEIALQRISLAIDKLS